MKTEQQTTSAPETLAEFLAQEATLEARIADLYRQLVEVRRQRKELEGTKEEELPF